MTQKTNATRFLDQTGIRYELREYQVDPEDLAAETIAAKIGLPPAQLFKTLVTQGDRHGICMAVIPADTELDLKALAGYLLGLGACAAVPFCLGSRFILARSGVFACNDSWPNWFCHCVLGHRHK